MSTKKCNDSRIKGFDCLDTELVVENTLVKLEEREQNFSCTRDSNPGSNPRAYANKYLRREVGDYVCFVVEVDKVLSKLPLLCVFFPPPPARLEIVFGVTIAVIILFLLIAVVIYMRKKSTDTGDLPVSVFPYFKVG